MRVVFDIETNALHDPTDIWVIVAKDIDTNKYYIFRNVTSDAEAKAQFIEFSHSVTLWVGHNILNFDLPVLSRLLGWSLPCVERTLDTLVLSRLVDYSREGGHSLESYGIEFGFQKSKNYYLDFFKHWAQPLEDYCVRDVDLTHKVYLRFNDIISDPVWAPSINLEQQFQLILNSVHDHGFAFNSSHATSLLNKVKGELDDLDKEIEKSFPPKLKLIREIHPRLTQYGTLHRGDFRFVKFGDLSEYNGGPFCRCDWQPFNAASPKQVIEVLHKAGWSPIDKTDTHVKTLRELAKSKRSRNPEKDVEIAALSAKLEHFSKYGWKINENNLSSLPVSAPQPSRLLAKRILRESRRRTLIEWISLVCTKIEISKESIDVLGHAIKEKLMLSGVLKNKNVIEKDIVKEISNVLENHTYTNSKNTLKKNVNEDIIFGLNTDLLSKSLINCLKTKKVNVNSVEEKENYLWITITPQEKLEDCSANPAILFLDGLRSAGLRYSIISERVKGEFAGIGAWTHRMAHQKPNLANIPNEYHENGTLKYLGKELRSLWMAPPGRLLCGVDAEGIQLRIFAHYVNNPELIKSLVNGRKENRTDPHSLNRKILGTVCKTRQAAKRFLYSLLLGGGISKFSQILECTEEQAKEAVDIFNQRYPGFADLKRRQFPSDAKRGFFEGLDGRRVPIPGSTVDERKHLCMSGYLQCGEATIIKLAAVHFTPELKRYDSFLVDIIHDEYQLEVPNKEIGLEVAKIVADSIRWAGEELKLNCPMQGAYYDEDHGRHTIGTNWYQTH